jgi:molybdopterin-guanine dinucleotide biosynthesis protein MobB
MTIIAFVGPSGVGKTQLISRLIPELKRRGRSTAIIKHCHHGFTLSPEGKDSWQFTEAGSDSVCMIGPNGLALLQKDASNQTSTLSTIAEKHFQNVDLVLVEGGRSESELMKIEILRKGLADNVETPTNELLAVISDFEVSAGRPVYQPDQIAEIADLLESYREDHDSRIYLHIDGISVPLKPFVQKAFENVVMGLVSALKGVRSDPKHITLSLTREETTHE